MFFTFPEDAHWDDEGQAVEFGVAIGEYEGVVRVPRRMFQRPPAAAIRRRVRLSLIITKPARVKMYMPKRTSLVSIAPPRLV